MRSAGNFHPQWGYLAPAPTFLRGARIVVVATAVGATAGAAVVVSLLGRPGADADNSIAAHALVTSAPVASAASPVSTSTAVAAGTPAPNAAAPASKPVLAQAPAAAAQPASPKPVLANASDAASANSAPSTTPATASAPLAAAATAESKPAAPTRRLAGRRHRTASNEPVRRWQGENVWRRRHWRDNGFSPFRLFSSRAGSSDYPN
jgi:hypothetical protein